MPKVHRKKLRASDATQPKGSNPQKRSSSTRHSDDVTPRRSRNGTGNVSPRKRKSASAALGRENGGFGQGVRPTGERIQSYQGEGSSCGAGGHDGPGWNGSDGDGDVAGSLPVGYGTLHTAGSTPKASVEVILKSASDGNMVRL